MAKTIKKADEKSKAPSKPKAAEKAVAEKPATKKAVSEKPAAKKTAAKKPESATDAPAVKAVSQEEIAALAHHYWAERGYQHGYHAEDWARAERELRSKVS